MFGHPWSLAEARDVDSLHAYYLPTSMLSMRRSSIVADSTEWFGVGGGHSPDGDGDGDGDGMLIRNGAWEVIVVGVSSGRLVLPNVHPRVLKRKAYLDVDTFCCSSTSVTPSLELDNNPAYLLFLTEMVNCCRVIVSMVIKFGLYL
ncbi:hypothetical protein Pyn_31696 [Prunus yedoensis var. nudiflora]|uniref:Uncharacterized protein n=1 Tax=Prunus yedoensis var. nudiflora TaxID=2094558 RepID=A0A314Y9G5_PRUYE|nr:hypothetical protein Pyn_31696 [Prunus yedoensis var. nudiflora]